MADLAAAAKAGSIDLVIVAIPFAIEHRLLQTLKLLWPLPVDVRIAGQASQLKLSPRAYGYLGKLPLLSVFDRPLKGRRQAKNVLDRTLAGLLLVLLLPVMALAALALRLESREAVLVKEMAHGFDGTAIAVYRLRGGARPASWLGRGMACLGLDRVPRLLNVLKGELSLVGPRLHAAATAPDADGSLCSLYRQVIDGYFARHDIKPGITGWAQINGPRGDVQMLERTAKHDLEYVDRWSLLFDLYILFKAPFSLLKRPSGV
jgi:lipopolysaccharide/colanic/teichoic acid biosynthesis glycosyltransferase